ncbi:hypothetical protein [Saccharothrix luteola]|uniref:hypothetical protein n=1 Tax=Saccharothrix luteola TaxID=2893018 RepID=UPI001E4FFCE4|nr:hypothetical protein [Saccharothrix luteola]MCC8244880.1 hypothetical protein [Saccharothrix luteola]
MRLRRLLRCAALVLGLSAATAVAGPPVATADAADCHFYLLMQGHGGLIVDSACGFGEDGNVETCKSILVWANVTPQAVVDEACRLASLP